MGEITRGGNRFVGYEYMVVHADRENISLYLDSYESFGWIPDDNIQPTINVGKVIVKMKRDRKILNKAELTRLQRHFEACMEEIAKLEQSKHSAATMMSITVGLIGTAFMAGSTFAVTHEPPLILLCIVLAIPGFIGWILPYFRYNKTFKSRAAKINPLIEQKYDEIYDICEKGNALL